MTEANPREAVEATAAERPVVRARPKVLIAPVAATMPADPPQAAPARTVNRETSNGQQFPTRPGQQAAPQPAVQAPPVAAQPAKPPARSAGKKKTPAPRPTQPANKNAGQNGSNASRVPAPQPFVAPPGEAPTAAAAPQIYLPREQPQPTEQPPAPQVAAPSAPVATPPAPAPEKKRGRLGGLSLPRPGSPAPAAAGAAAGAAVSPVLRESGNTPAASTPAAKTPSVVRSVRRPASRPGVARVYLTHVDPWSVMKQAFLLSLAIAIIILVAAGALWFALDSAGVFDALTRTATEVGGDGGNNLSALLSFSKIMGVALILAGVETILTTALVTLFAFMYNLAVGIGGGLEVTLSEEN